MLPNRDEEDMNASNSTTPLIFLDIDGVMNTTDSCLRHRSGEVFVPEAVMALSWLVRRTGASVVVTSTHRRVGLVAMRALFTRNDLAEVAGQIIGLTQLLVNYDTDDYREDEIQGWLDDHPHAGGVIILDDKPLASPLAGRLSLTNPDTGLTLELARRAASLLKAYKAENNPHEVKFSDE